MDKSRQKRIRRKRAHNRLRQRVIGTPERPRLAVYKSLRYIYAQLIDDIGGVTLAQANSKEADLAGRIKGAAGNSSAARVVGEAIGERAKSSGIDRVVFDRGGNIYHGKIKAVAEGARESGLNF